MKASKFWPAAVTGLALLSCSPALRAQTISFPQAGQQVRGTIKVTFEDIPTGGYVMVYLDGTGLDNLREATAQPFHLLNTFALPEGQHTLTIVAFNAGGKKAGTSSVTFEVANSSVDADAEGVHLRVWNARDRSSDVVRRYRIVAESNATIDDGQMGGGGGGAGGPGGGAGGAGGGGESQDAYIPAPLDYQLDILIRSVVRDVGLVDGAANIRSIVQEGYQRQRLSENGGGGAGGPGGAMGGGTAQPRKKKKKASLSGPTKAPWGEWGPTETTGRYFVKMVKQNGEEINATRKAVTLAIGDLLPRFPQSTVHPGSTWETDMSIVGEIPASVGVNVRAPMTFVSFEKIQTPSGIERRCAKLESRFSLPRPAAERIARSIQKQVGSGNTGGAGGPGGGAMAVGGPGGGAAGGGGGETEPVDFASVSTTVNREIWFDIEGNQVLRSTDTVDTSYEEEKEEVETGGAGGPGGAGGGMGMGELGGGAGGAGGQSQPKKVAYSLRITKYLDDIIPGPSNTFNGGAGTAHARDNVTDPGISKILAKP